MREDRQAVLLQLAEEIHRAAAIVIGGGSGLSSAAGYDHYHWSPAFDDILGPFRDNYGFPSPMAVFYYCFSSFGAEWAYYSRYIRAMWDAPTGQPYLDLRAMVSDKPVHVLTTNVDRQFFRVFPEEQICAFQGDFGYCQCSQPCQDAIWENRSLVEALTAQLDGVSLPEDAVPRCPDCGRVLVPWVRDDTFLEGMYWHQSLERYHGFLRHWLIDIPGKRVLLLELGVGDMTPASSNCPSGSSPPGIQTSSTPASTRRHPTARSTCRTGASTSRGIWRRRFRSCGRFSPQHIETHEEGAYPTCRQIGIRSPRGSRAQTPS